jgi:hydroxyacyl-ACP dehydratase HTD2-like protein with hotdog domain
MPERLLTIDHGLRRFQYRITSPLFVEHLSTIDVHDLHDGTCLTVYSVDAEPAVLALVIYGAARAALLHLPELLDVQRVS